MPDYADNYTARYKMRYTCGGQTHTQQWRMGTAATVAAALAAIDDLRGPWTAVGTAMASDLAFLDAVFYPVNSDVALPAPLPSGIETVVSSGSADASAGPKYLSVPWMTSIGGKQTAFFYGVFYDPDEIVGFNYRVEASESPLVTDLVAALNSYLPLVTGNDRASGLVCKNYANFGINPALVRRKRRG